MVSRRLQPIATITLIILGISWLVAWQLSPGKNKGGLKNYLSRYNKIEKENKVGIPGYKILGTGHCETKKKITGSCGNIKSGMEREVMSIYMQSAKIPDNKVINEDFFESYLLNGEASYVKECLRQKREHKQSQSCQRLLSLLECGKVRQKKQHLTNENDWVGESIITRMTMIQKLKGTSSLGERKVLIRRLKENLYRHGRESYPVLLLLLSSPYSVFHYEISDRETERKIKRAILANIEGSTREDNLNLCFVYSNYEIFRGNIQLDRVRKVAMLQQKGEPKDLCVKEIKSK